MSFTNRKTFVHGRGSAIALLFWALPTQAQGTGLEWATYLGGSGKDYVVQMTRTSGGNIVLAGHTPSADFPVTGGPGHAGGYDSFVSVLDATGSTLLYSRLFGGGGNDYIQDIQLGPGGEIYAVGLTSTTDFATTEDAIQPMFGGGNWDGFVAAFPPDLGDVSYLSYLGGSNFDLVGGVRVRATGVLTIAGSTRSTDFPITPATALQTSNAGGNSDYFLCRIDLAQATLLYGTYLGGSGPDGLTSGSSYALKDPRIHESSNGVVTLVGRTGSSDIVRTTTGYDDSFNSLSSSYPDAYVAMVDPSVSGTAGLVYDTYLGADVADAARAIDVDAAGVLTIGGWTDSSGFPITAGALGTTFIGPAGVHDAFLVQLDPAQTGAQQLLYSTLLSGDGYENVLDLVLDSRGRILAQGYSGNSGLVSNVFPTTPGAFQRTFAGEWDGFLVYVDPAGQGSADLLYSTFAGGVGWDVRSFGLEIVSRKPTLRVVSAGGSGAFGFPTTPGCYQASPTGLEDGLVFQLEVRRKQWLEYSGPIGSALPAFP